MRSNKIHINDKTYSWWIPQPGEPCPVICALHVYMKSRRGIIRETVTVYTPEGIVLDCLIEPDAKRIRSIMNV